MEAAGVKAWGIAMKKCMTPASMRCPMPATGGPVRQLFSALNTSIAV
jgi:hypothetical protein